MTRHELKGGCHCGNIRAEIELPRAPDHYKPRVCDCDFCRKHGAAYLSDPDGALRLHVRNAHRLGKYRQGSASADFLLCTHCGVLVGVCYEDAGRLYATINSRIVEDGTGFGEMKSVSPKTLAASEKIARWKALWFTDVIIAADAAGVGAGETAAASPWRLP